MQIVLVTLIEAPHCDSDMVYVLKHFILQLVIFTLVYIHVQLLVFVFYFFLETIGKCQETCVLWVYVYRIMLAHAFIYYCLLKDGNFNKYSTRQNPTYMKTYGKAILCMSFTILLLRIQPFLFFLYSVLSGKKFYCPQKVWRG